MIVTICPECSYRHWDGRQFLCADGIATCVACGFRFELSCNNTYDTDDNPDERQATTPVSSQDEHPRDTRIAPMPQMQRDKL
jgi:hypothetical protein